MSTGVSKTRWIPFQQHTNWTKIKEINGPQLGSHVGICPKWNKLEIIQSHARQNKQIAFLGSVFPLWVVYCGDVNVSVSDDKKSPLGKKPWTDCLYPEENIFFMQTDSKTPGWADEKLEDGATLSSTRGYVQILGRRPDLTISFLSCLCRYIACECAKI